MSGLLFDTSVLLDIATADPLWLPWSEKQFRMAAAQGPILINPIIYAELAPPLGTQMDRQFADVVERETAPTERTQQHVGQEKLRPRRVEMDVFAEGAQVTGGGAIHDQGLVPPAEEVNHELVTAVQAAGVGAQ